MPLRSVGTGLSARAEVCDRDSASWNQINRGGHSHQGHMKRTQALCRLGVRVAGRRRAGHRGYAVLIYWYASSPVDYD
jgi:hypothetical protein